MLLHSFADAFVLPKIDCHQSLYACFFSLALIAETAIDLSTRFSPPYTKCTKKLNQLDNHKSNIINLHIIYMQIQSKTKNAKEALFEHKIEL